MNKLRAPNKFQCINFRLPDDLLLEIFIRLPTFESIVGCKNVCKRWLNLITTPGFDARFIAYRINAHLLSENSKSDDLHPHVFYIRHYLNAQTCIYPNPTSSTSIDSLLSFIPAYQGYVDSLAIKSWCNDLVLCTSALPKELELYICNPRTRQYIQLPPPSNREQRCLVAFTWVPYYTFDKETSQVTLNKDFRYCVCYAIPSFSPSSRLQVQIFSSETRVWKKAELCTPHRFKFMCVDQCNCFTYKGMLHFYSDEAIVGFDPYKIERDGVIHCHFIEMPPYNRGAKHNRSVSVGVFGEQLLVVECRSRLVYRAQDIAQLSIEQNTAYAITAWELKNYNTGEWSMKHMIYLHEFISEDSVLTERIKRGCPFSRLKYIYPNDADILLLLGHGQVVECNMKTKTLKTVCRFPEFVPTIYGVAIQWWPSPLPLNI